MGAQGVRDCDWLSVAYDVIDGLGCPLSPHLVCCACLLAELITMKETLWPDCTTSQPIDCQGDRMSASLVQLNSDALTAQPSQTTSAEQPMFWDSNSFHFKCSCWVNTDQTPCTSLNQNKVNGDANQPLQTLGPSEIYM